MSRMNVAEATWLFVDFVAVTPAFQVTVTHLPFKEAELEDSKEDLLVTGAKFKDVDNSLLRCNR